MRAMWPDKIALKRRQETILLLCDKKETVQGLQGKRTIEHFQSEPLIEGREKSNYLLASLFEIS